MNRTLRPLAVLLFLGGAIVQTSCGLNPFCLDCEDPNLLSDAAGTGGDSGLADGGDVDGDGGVGEGDAGPCVPTGSETCDGEDNDCDGDIDEGNLPNVGQNCGTNQGECMRGTTICSDEGEVVCGDGAVNPMAELCNDLDDDCDGDVDENNPQGGQQCGTNLGECSAGFITCIGGTPECTDEVTGDDEECDGLDNDCDGDVDEDIASGGNCTVPQGPGTDEGICEFGSLICVGGAFQCSGAVFPEPEECDGVDHDCDGDDLNGFALDANAQNCNECGNACSAPNAITACDVPTCTGGGEPDSCDDTGILGCYIAACVTNYWNNNAGQVGSYDDGCEYGPCTFQGSETCNGADDDCDGDTDADDDDLVVPSLCLSFGECTGTDPDCISGGWECNYTGDISTDGGGNIVPEADCDGLDNDCDGSVDEGFPLLGTACSDGELGVCADSGIWQCNDDDDGIECSAVDDDTPGTESCNGLDDDCDGVVDNGGATGVLANWVSLGNDVDIMQYEASRVDSDASTAGVNSTGIPCSESGRLPWTNITHPDAEAACALVGGYLCDEDDWQLACGLGTVPYAFTNYQIEAEDFDNSVQNTAGDEWVVVAQAGASGGDAIETPDGDVSSTEDPSDLSESPRVDYDVNFTTTGTHYFWVRVWADNSGDDSMWLTLDDTGPDIGFADSHHYDVDLSDGYDQWLWLGGDDAGVRMSFDVDSTGIHTISVFHRNDGLLFDQIVVSNDFAFNPETGLGSSSSVCTWSYQNDCTVYDGDTCNGDDYDAIPGGGNDDEAISTGALAECVADWGGAGLIYDLSGNVKEWTAERSTDVNPLRGGAYNNSPVGIGCDYRFLTADDTFLLPSAGFRCCRDTP